MFAKTITEFGARHDTLCTAAIQNAIDACHAEGGGEVIIEDGTYVTGTLFLRSFVTLVIRSNAVLQASTDGADYPDFEPCFGKENAPRKTARCLIYAENCERIGISGGGVIDCCGAHFCAPIPESTFRFWRRTTDELPARMVFFYSCRHVTVRDITMREMAGGWAYWVNGCDYVTMDSLRILCNPAYPNSDGVHINCSSDVTLTNSMIHCGDDAVIVRANNKTMSAPRPCQRIAVSNCTISSRSCAIRIGWTNDGVIENCTFSNLSVTDSWYGISIEFPEKSEAPFSDQGYDYTVVRNLLFDNIVMDRLDTAPIRILAYPYNQVKSISHIKFCGIVSDSKELPIFRVEKGVEVRDIALVDCDFTVDADASLRCMNIAGVRMDGIVISCR